MARVVIAAEKTTKPVLLSYKLTTEDRPKEGTTDDYEFRAILRVIVEQTAENITFVGTPSNNLSVFDSLTVRFNQDSEVTIEPLYNSFFDTAYPFKLVDQDYSQYEAKGSKFFIGTLEYVCVSDWEDLVWTGFS